MTVSVAGRRYRPLLFVGLGCLGLVFAAVTHPKTALVRIRRQEAPPRADHDQLDQAKWCSCPNRIATLVIGNPLIADATVQRGGVVVLTGKGYGTTNLVALDRAARIVEQDPSRWSARADAMVVVFAVWSAETYSRAPDCERRIALGDLSAFSDAT